MCGERCADCLLLHGIHSDTDSHATLLQTATENCGLESTVITPSVQMLQFWVRVRSAPLALNDSLFSQLVTWFPLKIQIENFNVYSICN